MKRLFALLLVLTLFPAGFLLAESTDPAAAPRAVIEALYAGEYLKVFELSTNEVKGALGSEASLAQIIAQLTAAYGPYESILEAKAELHSGRTEAMIVCSHQYADITYSVVLDSEGKIAGFTIAGLTPKAAPAENADSGIVREDILLRPGEKDETKGILTLPAGEGPFPSVVMMQGSGPSDMNETAYGIAPFRDIADGLAKLGIASIRYDKYTYAHADLLKADADLYARLTVTEEYINDAVAAVSLLKADPRISSVFLLGHSQGAMLLPRTASVLGAGSIAGGVMLSGTPLPLWELQYHQNLVVVGSLKGTDKTAAEALLSEEIKKLESFQGMTAQELLAQTFFGIAAYYQMDEMKVDAAETAAALGIRLFIAQGGKDWQVTPANGIDAWEKALEGKTEADYMLYENMNHMLVDMEGEPAGTSSDYKAGSTVSEALISDIAAWINAE